MKWSAVASLALVGASSAKSRSSERTFALMQFNGKALCNGRVDPIVSPGQKSSHVHTVMGASNFGKDATGEKLFQSKCTNAKLSADKSAYWVPRVYFKDPQSGTFEPVPLYYANAYYFFEPTDDDIKAFPLGLSMVSGDAMTRTAPKMGGLINLDPDFGPINSAQFTCTRQPSGRPSWPVDSDGSMAGMKDPGSNYPNSEVGVGFPSEDCDGTYSPLRADIYFPSCYNPKAGLTNFKENMVFPSAKGASAPGRRNCPEGFIHVPHLLFEVYWDTQKFSGRWNSGVDEQPFVLSNGDTTGFSSHGDFMCGWDEDVLQNIIDNCNAGHAGIHTCPGVEHLANHDECSIPNPDDEEIDGTLPQLPGNNLLTGWKYGIGALGSNPLPLPIGKPDSNPLPVPLPNLPNPSEVELPKPVAGNQESKPVISAAPEKPKEPACVPKVVTVWETVTVEEDEAKPTPEVKDRRRHVHRHGHRRS